METIDCILCGDSLEKRTDKNGKPYFVCDACGTQFFVRGSQGISKLEALIQGKGPGPRRIPKDIVKEIPALKSDLEGLRELAEDLEDWDWLPPFCQRLNRLLGWLENTAARQ